MLANYLPTLLFLIVATGIGITLMVVGRFLGPRRPGGMIDHARIPDS